MSRRGGARRKFHGHAKELEVNGKVSQVRMLGGATLNPERLAGADQLISPSGISFCGILDNRDDLLSQSGNIGRHGSEKGDGRKGNKTKPRYLVGWLDLEFIARSRR